MTLTVETLAALLSESPLSRVGPEGNAPGASRVTIYSEGPLTLSVCAPREMSAAEVLADVERQHPCGTTNGWQLSPDEWMTWDKDKGEKVKTGRVGPIPCDQYGLRTHWLLTA